MRKRRALLNVTETLKHLYTGLGIICIHMNRSTHNNINCNND